MHYTLLAGPMTSKRPLVTVVALGWRTLAKCACHTRSALLALVKAAVRYVRLLAGNPALLFAVALMLTPSRLLIPGGPQTFFVEHLVLMAFVGLMIVRIGTGKPPPLRQSRAAKCLVGFGLVLVVLMCTRGIGFRLLGSDIWGGTWYVKLLLGIALVLTVPYVEVPRHYWKRIVVGMLFMSMIPAAAQGLYLLSGGLISQQFILVDPGSINKLTSALDSVASGQGVPRLHLFGGLGRYLLVALLVFWPLRGPYRLFFPFLALLSIGVVALSGFRSLILGAMGMLALFAIFYRPEKRMVRAVWLAVSGLVALIAVYTLAPCLPLPLQRSVAFLPYLECEPAVQLDILNSNVGRILIWKMAWKEIPQYLWVGKGLCYDPGLVASLEVSGSWAETKFAAQAYHSGPLSLLVDTGIPGLLCGLGFMLFSGIDVLRTCWRLEAPPLLRRIYLAFGAGYLFSIFSYWVIFGDIKTSLPSMMVQYAMLRTLGRTISSMGRETTNHPDQPHIGGGEWGRGNQAQTPP